eukprot:gene5522-6207_t
MKNTAIKTAVVFLALSLIKAKPTPPSASTIIARDTSSGSFSGDDMDPNSILTLNDDRIDLEDESSANDAEAESGSGIADYEGASGDEEGNIVSRSGIAYSGDELEESAVQASNNQTDNENNSQRVTQYGYETDDESDGSGDAESASDNKPAKNEKELIEGERERVAESLIQSISESEAEDDSEARTKQGSGLENVANDDESGFDSESESDNESKPVVNNRSSAPLEPEQTENTSDSDSGEDSSGVSGAASGSNGDEGSFEENNDVKVDNAPDKKKENETDLDKYDELQDPKRSLPADEDIDNAVNYIKRAVYEEFPEDEIPAYNAFFISQIDNELEE